MSRLVSLSASLPASLALMIALGLAPAIAAPSKESAPKEAKDKDAKDKSSPLGALGGGGKEPIKIDADRLDVFDKENKAIFAGNVVAVQGDATIRCSALTVYYNRGKKDGKDKDGKDAKGDKSTDEGGKSASEMAENGIRKVDCAGPVTVKQKDQVATGDNATFDQVARKIVLTGNVVLSQCQNVTRGSRLVYDMESGRANMDPGANGRVSAMFVPGEKSEGGTKGAPKGCAQPAAAKSKPDASAAAADKLADKPATANSAKSSGNPSAGSSKTRAQAN